jgi:hypothetical protein
MSVFDDVTMNPGAARSRNWLWLFLLSPAGRGGFAGDLLSVVFSGAGFYGVHPG